MINFDKITDIFSTADEFCLEFKNFTQPFVIGNPPKKKPNMSDAEVITIMILFQLSSFRTFKYFYIYYVQKHMKQKFSQTVSYKLFTELIQSNLMCLTIFAKTCSLGQCTGISFLDTTPIKVCGNKRIKRNKVFNIANVGKSTMG